MDTIPGRQVNYPASLSKTALAEKAILHTSAQAWCESLAGDSERLRRAQSAVEKDGMP